MSYSFDQVTMTYEQKFDYNEKSLQIWACTYFLVLRKLDVLITFEPQIVRDLRV